jgi:hypothetical protein
MLASWLISLFCIFVMVVALVPAQCNKMYNSVAARVTKLFEDLPELTDKEFTE